MNFLRTFPDPIAPTGDLERDNAFALARLESQPLSRTQIVLHLLKAVVIAAGFYFGIFHF